MTDPFDALFADVEPQEEDSEWAPVTNSELECEQCFQISTNGEYSFKRKTLRWKCPKGHKNIVVNLVIEGE